MKAMRILCLGLATAIMSGCAAVRIDPAVSRPALQTAARPHIDKALTTPLEDLYAAVETGNAFDALDLGLALMAGRHREPTAQDLADMEVLAAVETRLRASAGAWRAKYPGKSLFYSDWAKTAPISEAERAIALRLMKGYSADYWLGRALNATSSQTLYIYQPAMRAGGTGTTMPMQISSRVVDSSVIMTAAHCVNSVRQGLSLPGGEPDLITFRLLYPMQADMVRSLADDLAVANPERAYFAGPDACGSEGPFLNYLKLRNAETFTPSPLGMRFGVGG